jgi:hypothetical protein
MTSCPACGLEMRQVGTGMGCDACGLYMGPGGGGASGSYQRLEGVGGAGGMASYGLGRMNPYLTKMTVPPNPLLPEVPMVKKGDRVGFKMHYGEDAGRVLIGVVASVETDRATGSVQVTLEDDSITELED